MEQGAVVADPEPNSSGRRVGGAVADVANEGQFSANGVDGGVG
jgi:hypothetical protein